LSRYNDIGKKWPERAWERERRNNNKSDMSRIIGSTKECENDVKTKEKKGGKIG